MNKREFRTQESYKAESITRDLLCGFLESKGFFNIDDQRKPHGATESQTIHAHSPTSEKLSMRVKLCWRPKDRGKVYSAVQLLAKIKNNDWDKTLRQFIDRAKQDSISHFLFVQREGQTITLAAMVPVSELLAIWWAQHKASESLLIQGKLRRRKKNHAMNGSSPTLLLHDDEAPLVVDALWKHPGVQDLVHMEQFADAAGDDAYDDTSGVDYSLIGSDGAPAVLAVRTLVKRDQRVRMAVLGRAKGRCEKCGGHRDYPGFLDVHHILGADKSDRVWNCVALCPNCHREAHIAPDREQINTELLELAMVFKSEN